MVNTRVSTGIGYLWIESNNKSSYIRRGLRYMYMCIYMYMYILTMGSLFITRPGMTEVPLPLQ